MAVEGWVDATRGDLRVVEEDRGSPISELKLLLASNPLTGDARTWWIQYRPQNPTKDVDALFEVVREEFISPEHELILRENLSKLRHTGRAETYIQRFWTIANEGPFLSDREKHTFFVQGLSPEMHFEVRRKKADTLREAVHVVRELEVATDISGHTLVPRAPAGPVPRAPPPTHASVGGSHQPPRAPALAVRGDVMEIGNTEGTGGSGWVSPPNAVMLTPAEREALRAAGGYFKCRRPDC